MTHEELVAKAREAKSAEEIMEMAKAEGMELTEEAAAEYYAMLNPESGELSDDELDNVSGGGCKTKVNGKKYTVVTSGCRCFTGQYKEVRPETHHMSTIDKTWRDFSSSGCCGRCFYLRLNSGGIGYCVLS
ncbi:MAG: hypothetical protein IKJ01_04225 [Lachnospiraceae bacterium]|nr:hypothetical protein [Lachnospiraceae bacterium]